MNGKVNPPKTNWGFLSFKKCWPPFRDGLYFCFMRFGDQGISHSGP